jgi:hypothetical protein
MAVIAGKNSLKNKDEESDGAKSPARFDKICPLTRTVERTFDKRDFDDKPGAQ